MNIYVNKSDIENAINHLDENNNKLLIGNNLFSIEYISTLINLQKEENNVGQAYYNYVFSFSYNDGVFKDNVKIIATEEPISCYSFLVKSEIIDEKNREAIFEKAFKTIADTNDKWNVEIPKDKLNKIVYNEALIFISNGINNGDKQFTQDDFKSKYDTYKEAQEKINNETYDAISNLYKKIINIKISKKD